MDGRFDGLRQDEFQVVLEQSGIRKEEFATSMKKDRLLRTG